MSHILLSGAAVIDALRVNKKIYIMKHLLMIENQNN